MASNLGRVRIAIMIMLIIVFAGLGVFLSVNRQKPPIPDETPAPTVTERHVRPPMPVRSEAEISWEKFVSDAKASCEKDVRIAYEAYHEYGDQHFGVIVVGWKESEYEIDLYRYDRAKNDWECSPVVQENVNVTDIPGTSKKWGIPGNVIKQWVDEADATAYKAYNQKNK